MKKAQKSPSALYQRMETIRFSGAAGVHADQNRKTDQKRHRRSNRQEERRATRGEYD